MTEPWDKGHPLKHRHVALWHSATAVTGSDSAFERRVRIRRYSAALIAAISSGS